LSIFTQHFSLTKERRATDQQNRELLQPAASGHSRPVLPLCYYGEVLDFMIKKTLDYKSNLTHSESAQKMRCNANCKHCAIHCKQETKKMGH